MRSIFWPTIFLLVLCILWGTALPIWLEPVFIPNLLLGGLMVLAMTDADADWFLLAPLFGLWLDFQSNVLIGSYSVGFLGIYLVTRYLFRHIVPSSRIHFAIPITFIFGSGVLQAWLWLYGVFASKLGWPIVPSLSMFTHFTWWVVCGLGSALAVLMYIFWLEIMHRFDRPIRMRV